MNKKLPVSRMTSATNNYNGQKINSKTNKQVQSNRTGMTSIIDSKQPSYPIKFGKIRNRKQTQTNIHSQTAQNPERSSIRIYTKAYESRVFEDETSLMSQSQIINKQPKYIFNNNNYVSQLKPGQCSYLKKQSNQPIQFKKQKTTAYNGLTNPITMGQSNSRYNSTLSNGWKQERRHRDNGANCSQTLQWDPQLKRDPYQHFPMKKNKSYLDLYYASQRQT